MTAPRNNTNRQNRRPAGPPPRQAPGPLLAVLATTAIIFAVLAVATQEWVFLALGIFGIVVGLVPLFSRDR